MTRNGLLIFLVFLNGTTDKDAYPGRVSWFDLVLLVLLSRSVASHDVTFPAFAVDTSLSTVGTSKCEVEMLSDVPEHGCTIGSKIGAGSDLAIIRTLASGGTTYFGP